jgi:hypothetical protein
MQISGHRTRSVFDRYDITTEKDAMDPGATLERPWRQMAERETNPAIEQSESQKFAQFQTRS